MPTGRRAGAGTRYRPSIETAERDREIALFLADLTQTQQDAAEHFGMAKSSVHQAVQRVYDAIRREGSEPYIAAQLLSIAARRQVLWAVLRDSHIRFSDGRVVVDLETGLTERDWRHIIDANRELDRLDQREAKLKGLDAPIKQTITVLTPDLTEQAIADLEAEIAELDRAEGRSVTGPAAVPEGTAGQAGS